MAVKWGGSRARDLRIRWQAYKANPIAHELEGPAGPGILAQHPLGRISMPDEVAAAAAFCALDAPAAMTGCIIDVNDANSLRT